MSIQILGLGEVFPDENFDLKIFPVSPKTYLDRASALALAAASLALQNAGVNAPLGEDFGLVTITKNGCVETMRAFEAILHDKGTKGASPLLFSHSYFNSPAAILAIEWGIQGYHSPLVGNDFGVALDHARDILESGYASQVLVGAFEAKSLAREWSGQNGREGAIFFVIELSTQDDGFETAREKLSALAS